MYIGYGNGGLEKLCTTANFARRRFPSHVAKALFRRLEQLAAFDTLAEVPHTPPFRLHLLTNGEFGVDLGDQYRLTFVPAGEFRTLPDGGVDRKTVTAITVSFVGDYHG
jgi:plasmid maintenance system killer protein